MILYGTGIRLGEVLNLRVGRWHMDESLLQRAVREAIVKAGITKPASCHSDIRTTMVYTHVLNRREGEIVSPLDRM